MTSTTRLLVAASLLAAAFIAVGCAGERELEFADWLIPVPEGTPIREYGPVAIEDRDPDAVRLVADLVITEDLGNPDAILYEPGPIAVSAAGNIFVADRGEMDIKVFHPDGRHWKTLGQEGQGPAEFGRISSMTIAGETLVVYDSRNRRFSLWTLQGEHITEHTPADRASLSSVQGLADGTVMATVYDFNPQEESNTMSLVRRSAEGEELGRFLEIQLPMGEPLDRSNPRASLQMVIDSMDEPRMTVAVATRTTTFVTPVHEYQVLALTEEGDVQWALRVAWRRLPWSEFTQMQLLESFGEVFQIEDELSPREFSWAPSSAVGSIHSDGDGRLYVFPQMPVESEDPPEIRPVDVYSATGEFLAAGLVPNVWTYGAGEYVYGLRINEVEERDVVRYRLVLNKR